MQSQAGDAFQVFDWITSRHVHEYFDTAGRPVGEGRAAAFRDVATEMRSCPYTGSRHHHAKPMNASALQQMPPWEDVLTMLRWLSQRYRAAHRREVATCDDLAQVTGEGVFLADYLALRRHGALRSHEIPVLVSGLYKVCLGFQLAYLPERFADETTQLPDAAGFLDYLEANELLIGEAEVCAGSPAMIQQAYDAMVGGHAVVQEDLPAPCSSLQIAWDTFDVFADHAGLLWNELVLYAVRMPQFLPELAGAELPAKVEQRLTRCLQEHGTRLLAEQIGLVVDLARVLRQCGVCAPVGLPAESAGAQPGGLGGLAETVVAWLSRAAGADMQIHGPAVARALKARLAGYDLYEEAVLAGINAHLSCLMSALGIEFGAALTATALSHVCGRTLRDWQR